MKKTLAILAVFMFIIGFLYSCSKGDTPTPVTTGTNDTTKLGKLQNKWNIVSVVVYPTIGLSGPDSLVGYIGQSYEYYDFRTDGRIYAFVMGAFDTATYKFLGNDSVMLTNNIVKGVPESKGDTATIRILTNNSLVLVSRNIAGDYGKFTFKR